MDDSLHFETANYQFAELPITPASLCIAFGQVATLHGIHLGILRGFDPTRDCGWVILSLALKIHDSDENSAPTSNEFRVETWISAIEGAVLIREFRISSPDSQGHPKVLAEAAQSFVLFDRTTRKIVLPPRAKRDELKGHPRRLGFKLKMVRRNASSSEPSNIERLPAAARKTVTADNVDHNGHLNNAVYLAWLGEWIDQPAKNGTREIAVEFLREATLGDSLDVYMGFVESGCRSFAFVNAKTGQLAAEAQFISST